MKKHRNGENRHRCIEKYLSISVSLGKREICHRTDREKSANVWTVLRKKYAEYMDLLWGKVKRVKEKKIILFMELISV